jgi:pyridoxamine 5'-phosphate oxidase
MNDALFESAPGFDQPIAVLKHCHEKIRKQLKTLERLLEHLPRHGANREAQQAATAVLHYFTQGAPYHHADEEQNLMPMLSALASGNDAATLQEVIPQILSEHKKMDALWCALEPQLNAIAKDESAQLSSADVGEFNKLYTAHMLKEETCIAPMALRLFSDKEIAQLGEAMQQRRTQPPPPVTAAPLASSANSSANVADLADLADLRREYRQAELSEADVLSDPIAQFSAWFNIAQKAEVLEVNAMSLSTVGENGRPSSRIVLIKQIDANGLRFFTNYDSRKGQELKQNQFAALLFFWPELERQVRIEGRIERVDASDNDDYFNRRPLLSRLSALASAQSQPITSRAAMEEQLAKVSAEYGEHPVRPENWGGYRLIPDYFEFWQGRRSRFHDRITYQRQADGEWQRRRLQP